MNVVVLMVFVVIVVVMMVLLNIVVMVMMMIDYVVEIDKSHVAVFVNVLVLLLLLVVKKIVQYLDEELEVVRHKRKNPLLVLPKWTPLEKLENGTALIAFSRAEVLKLKQKLQKKYSVSVIYGNLSPEVRRYMPIAAP